jgi:hypothetical protein
MTFSVVNDMEKLHREKYFLLAFLPSLLCSEEEPANERDKKMTAKELQGC